MAVEVNSSKILHRHALPVVMIMTAAFLLIGALVLSGSSPNGLKSISDNLTKVTGWRADKDQNLPSNVDKVGRTAEAELSR